MSLAQLEFWNHSDKVENKLYTGPKHWDEKLSYWHLAKIVVELETLRKDQADFIGVKVDVPFKPDRDR